MSDPKEIVRRGYDAIADRYDEWAASFETPELRWVGELLERLPDRSRVLDLGCGGGRTSAQTIATLGTGGSEDVVEEDWLGAPMFFASFTAETNRRLLREGGFELVRHRVVPHEEPGHGPVSFMWVLARSRA